MFETNFPWYVISCHRKQQFYFIVQFVSPCVNSHKFYTHNYLIIYNNIINNYCTISNNTDCYSENWSIHKFIWIVCRKIPCQPFDSFYTNKVSFISKVCHLCKLKCTYANLVYLYFHYTWHICVHYVSSEKVTKNLLTATDSM